MNILPFVQIVLDALKTTEGTICLVIMAAFGFLVLQTVYKLISNAYWDLIGRDLEYKKQVSRQEASRVRRQKFREWEQKNPGIRQKYRKRYGG